MWNLIKMQFKSENFKRFNIFAIILNIIFIISATLKPENGNTANGLYQLFIIILVILFFNMENNKTNIILNSLPINKKDIVIKNYLYLFIIFLLANLYTYISFYVINKTMNSATINYMDFKNLVATISILIIQISIMLPILHLISGVFSYFIVYIGIIVGGKIILSYENSIENMLDKGNLYILPLIAFLIMALSIGISIFLYTHREFEGAVE